MNCVTMTCDDDNDHFNGREAFTPNAKAVRAMVRGHRPCVTMTRDDDNDHFNGRENLTLQRLNGHGHSH